jgi:lipopolysaccharide/colanic/teichoic acid biosynthesis glycosyltransferase
LFRQTRVGRGFRHFRIMKFRTMVNDAERLGGPLSVGADPRITRVGRALRRLKLDELPQLLNVLAGDMSLVGPRPEVPEYVERFRDEYEEILSIRPGLTDLASLKYRDESALLAAAADPAAEYVRVILPDKIRLGREYVRRASVMLDVSIILRTIGAVAGVAAVPGSKVGEPR